MSPNKVMKNYTYNPSKLETNEHETNEHEANEHERNGNFMKIFF